MKHLTALCFYVLLGLGVTACNTAAGVGQDVEATGEHIEDAAKKTQEKMSD